MKHHSKHGLLPIAPGTGMLLLMDAGALWICDIALYSLRRKKMRNFFVAVGILLTMFTPSAANAANVYGVRIVEHGVYDCSVKSYRPSPTGGNYSTVGDCRLLEAARTIRPRVGTTFGCFYELQGSPNGALVYLEYRWRIPNPGVKNPQTGEFFLEDNTRWERTIGQRQGGLWTVSHAGEMVTGEWTLEIRYEDRKLGECSFNVIVQ